MHLALFSISAGLFCVRRNCIFLFASPRGAVLNYNMEINGRQIGPFSFSLSLSHFYIEFSRVGWGVGQRDQSTASYWGLATPWQRYHPTSLPPFFSWLCVFTPGSFSEFRNTYGPGPQGPQPACSLGYRCVAFGCFIAGVLFSPVRGYQRSVRKWGVGCLMLGICFPMAPIPPS